MAKWRVEKSRDAADWEFQWVTISPNRKYLDWSSWDRAMGYVKYEISKERKAMTKTLADMTAEERADCVGMWCDYLVSTVTHQRASSDNAAHRWRQSMSDVVFNPRKCNNKY